MRAIILSVAMALWCGAVFAQVPHKLNYQGYLTNISGQPVDGSVSMALKLYDVASGGAALYSETQTVAVSNGVFDVVIGAQTPLNLGFDVPYYLGVTVGADLEMTPRQVVTAAPYSLRAANADALAPAAAVGGQQITGAITGATLSTGNLTGTVGTTQIANNAVTQAKLSPVAGGTAGKVLGTDGSNLQWQAPNAGTVTSVGTGTGLTGGPITGSGTINLAPAQLLPAVLCGPGQIPKSSGVAWTCGADLDSNSGGTVTSLTQGAGITLTPSPITGSGTIAIDPASSALTGAFFRQGGNNFGATAVLGTTGNNAAEIIANNQRALRIDYAGSSPNIALGHHTNTAGGVGGTVGATVSGGGDTGSNCFDPDTSTFTRPCSNRAMWFHTTVAGGRSNVADSNASTVSGGESNTANGAYSTVAGGLRNHAGGNQSFVAAGENNFTTGNYSFAGGRNAFAAHHGSFVWNADYGGSGGTYGSNAYSSFNIRAPGGIYLDTGTEMKSPLIVNNTLSVSGAVTVGGVLSFGAQTRQMLDLYGGIWGIGVQSSTQYFRSGNFFGWYLNGVHSDSALDAGGGGSILMALYPAAGPPGVLPTVTGIARAQTFVSTSDRNAKHNFAPVDAKAVLDKVIALPIATWNYKSDGSARHIGPVAQDFRRLFEVGNDNLGIATVDADGVALAAIQGLFARLEEREARLAQQQAEIDALKRSMAEMQRALRTRTPLATAMND